MQSFTALCVTLHAILCKKLLLFMLVLKLNLNYKISSTKLYAHEMFVSQEFRTTF